MSLAPVLLSGGCAISNGKPGAWCCQVALFQPDGILVFSEGFLVWGGVD